MGSNALHIHAYNSQIEKPYHMCLMHYYYTFFSFRLVVAYEFVSVFTFVYDLYLLITIDRDHDCYVFFVSTSLTFMCMYTSKQEMFLWDLRVDIFVTIPACSSVHCRAHISEGF